MVKTTEGRPASKRDNEKKENPFFHLSVPSAELLIADSVSVTETHLVSAGTPLCSDMKLFLRLRCVRSWL